MSNKLFEYVLNATALQRARWSTTAIMLLAAYNSFDHQRAYLLDWGANNKTSIIVPITVDLLAITCNIIVHIPDVNSAGFWVSLSVLVVAVGVSGTANFMAGETVVLQFANLWSVIAYLLSELVTAWAKPKAKPEQISKPKPEKTDRERLEAAKKRAGWGEMSQSEKIGFTKRWNDRETKRKQRELDSIEASYAMAEAQVSPAAPLPPKTKA